MQTVRHQRNIKWRTNNWIFIHKLSTLLARQPKPFSKISRLIHGRKGLMPATGITLYKCLVRPHLEFAIPALACTSAYKSWKRCKVDVWGRYWVLSACFCRCCWRHHQCYINQATYRGAIYTWVLTINAHSTVIRKLLEVSSLKSDKFTPMSYVKHQAKILICSTNNATITPEHATQLSELHDSVINSNSDSNNSDL